jgi:nicotinamide riboside kinase
MEKGNILKIAVVGAESTGKTRLCQQLSEHYHTVWVPEYAREYFNDSDIYNYSSNDLVKIAERQVEMEKQQLQKAVRFIFCDTTLITLKIWAELEFEEIPPPIIAGLKASHYDFYLITDNTISWVGDELRQNKHSRDLLLEMNINEVSKTGTPFSLITGQDNERLKSAIEAIDIRFSAQTPDKAGPGT